MLNSWKKLKNTSIKHLFKDSFHRDILTLLVVSIVVGSLLANAVSFSANTYFSKTLSNLVGDYGEYDLIIQSREEMKEDTAVHIEKIIQEVFPGSRLKEGPTLSGKTTFFVALPDEYKTQKIYEDLGKIFGGIPGGAGVGVVTDPRLTIRGVPEGAKNMLLERISHLEGVRFAFRDGGSIGVILKSLEQSSAVNQQINGILKQYQVLEISFPVGSEPANPIRLGETIAQTLETNLKLNYAKNVSIDGKNDDMTYMVSTMMELKRFLQAYASKVTIVPQTDIKLTKGDIVAFPKGEITAGMPIDRQTVLVEITELGANGLLQGAVIQGDASQLGTMPGYRVVKEAFGEMAGTATYRNPRQELGGALNETSKLVGQIPGFAQDAQNMSGIANNALNNYNASLTAMESTLSSMEKAGGSLQSAANGLANINTAALSAQVDSSSRAMSGFINSMQVLKLVNADVGPAIENVTSAQSGLNTLKAGLSALGTISADARKAKSALDEIVANGQTTVGALRSFDVEGTRQNLNNANNRLSQLNQMDIALVTGQLQYLAASVPNLKDEDISRSVKLLDKFIAGQVIPGERIQILTTSETTVDAVQPAIYQEVGHSNISIYSTGLGVIEPNPRGELAQVLKEVKSVLAGMTAMIVTILFLVLDHTAVMTAFRRKNRTGKQSVKGWRTWGKRVATHFWAPERRYGMGVGALLLTSIFLLSGGGIPYVPWLAVPVIGALLGWIVAGYAEKISPISSEEVMAGESLGLSFDEIMRELVIPSARPGLLQQLNQRKLKFK